MDKDSDKLIPRRPKEIIKMTVYDPKSDKWATSFAKNSCYLVKHSGAFDNVWTSKNTPDSAEED
jgi:hypothetical protein